MRLSRYFLPILRETPADARTVAHRLMLRAGMIRQAASGLYSWLPLGYRVLRRIEEIVHDEQQRAGAVPLLMPTVQPADLWRESGRYDDYGEEMLRIRDRHGRDLLYGPTNEEMITDIVRGSLTSYRDLPKILYHIQWKFRDEIRPRFGIMRAREFLMKDAYSFDVDAVGARHSYNRMFVSYLRTFARMGLTAVPVRADAGPIGGDMTHEFLILAETGESEIFVDSRLLDMDPIGEGIDFEDAEALERIVRDRVSKYARTDETHEPEVFEREVPSDFRRTARAIEVGHVFHFADKYSRPMQARVATEDGGEAYYQMGSYGIGVSRLVGALIEANHDDRGIIWPEPVAPFRVGLVNLASGDAASDAACEAFYSLARTHGLDVLYDDTNRRAGAKYAAMELIGLPWRVAVGPRNAAGGQVDLVRRGTGESETLSAEEAVHRLRERSGDV